MLTSYGLSPLSQLLPPQASSRHANYNHTHTPHEYLQSPFSLFSSPPQPTQSSQRGSTWLWGDAGGKMKGTLPRPLSDPRSFPTSCPSVHPCPAQPVPPQSCSQPQCTVGHGTYYGEGCWATPGTSGSVPRALSRLWNQNYSCRCTGIEIGLTFKLRVLPPFLYPRLFLCILNVFCLGDIFDAQGLLLALHSEIISGGFWMLDVRD